MEETLYYLHIDGQQKGPFPIHLLISEGLQPDTMVWRPGMQGWVQASSLPELAVLFAPGQPGYQQPFGQQQPYNPYGQQPQPQNPYGQQPYAPNYYRGSYPPGWTNWLGWAIAGTVLGAFTCCLGLIFGIIGIVKANQANTQARVGDYEQAQITNNSAKTWTIVSLVLGVLGIIATIFIFFSGMYEAMVFGRL